MHGLHLRVYGTQMLSAKGQGNCLVMITNVARDVLPPIMKNISKEKFFRLIMEQTEAVETTEKEKGISTSRTCGIVSVFDHICGNTDDV